jgi:hypothetical protein
VRYCSAPNKTPTLDWIGHRGTGGSTKLRRRVNQRLHGFAGSHAGLPRICVMYLAYERFMSVESQVIVTPRK